MLQHSTPISACEKDGQGPRQPALALLGETLGVTLEPAVICYSTASSACEKGQRQKALALLGETLGVKLGPTIGRLPATLLLSDMVVVKLEPRWRTMF